MKFSHAAWNGMFVGLDLMAETAENFKNDCGSDACPCDIHVLRSFLSKYRRTVAEFKAAHSEHMEESLKNAGIGRETKEA